MTRPTWFSCRAIFFLSKAIAVSAVSPSPASTITGLAWLTEGNILYREDARIDARQDVHVGNDIEELENIKKLPFGKLIKYCFLFSLLH